MRTVLPVSRHDLHLLPQWIETHQHLKGVGLNHSLHIVIPQAIESEAHDAKAALLGVFESISIHPMESEPMGGWPFAPNAQFWHCANAMARDNRGTPWQLVEPDCLPIRANAYDVVAAKYASCGAPFFGKVDKTPWRTDEGRITKSLYGDGDVMMSGCAVYPGDMLARPSLAGLMADFMKGQESIDQPWDMHLRAAMQAEGMAATELIGNYWNTGNYRVEGGRLVCDSLEDHEIFRQHPEWERRKCGGSVHPDAVMIHGCKDDSLFKLIIAGQIPDSLGLPIAVSAPVQQAATPSASPQPPSADARMDRLEGMLIKLLEQKTSAPPNAAQGEPARPASSDGHETKVVTEPLLDRVLSALPSVGNKKMLSQLSKSLSTSKDVVKKIVENSGKFSIRGPAEWVERIAA